MEEYTISLETAVLKTLKDRGNGIVLALQGCAVFCFTQRWIHIHILNIKKQTKKQQTRGKYYSLIYVYFCLCSGLEN